SRASEVNLNRRMEALENTTKEALEANQKQMQQMMIGLTTMATGMKSLTDQVQMNTASMHLLQIENYYRNQLTNLDDEVRHYRDMRRHRTSEADRINAEGYVRMLEDRRKGLLDERNQAMSNVHGARGLIPPAPPQINTTTPAQSATNNQRAVLASTS